ncbi:MAG TPA: undecaprenyl-diphosphate phosphatase [Fluviicola sp.]|nr:undecaprenyl-diphosphate phosphatase [Fluviicola sp.]
MSWLETILLALIEGLTEFLPVSSTGHMILGSAAMGVEQNDFTKLFMIVIQLGAILAVFVLYFKRFFQSINFYLKLIVAFIPAAIMGVLFSDVIDSLLESPLVVAISLVIGGVILLYVDRWFNKPTIETMDEMSYWDALKVGLFQCIATIPGVSRSGASIVGGMSQKMSRKLAAEFSFFLALPTMLGATAKKTLDYFQTHDALTSEQINTLILGNIVAFIVAILAIKSFIGFLNKYGFKGFGWYRIIFGSIILVLLLSGYNLTVV